MFTMAGYRYHLEYIIHIGVIPVLVSETICSLTGTSSWVSVATIALVVFATPAVASTSSASIWSHLDIAVLYSTPLLLLPLETGRNLGPYELNLVLSWRLASVIRFSNLFSTLYRRYTTLWFFNLASWLGFYDAKGAVFASNQPPLLWYPFISSFVSLSSPTLPFFSIHLPRFW